MYEVGMIRETEDIKLLILYAARCLARPVEKDWLIETISPGETVNYFELLSVFDDLLVTGHMDVIDYDGVMKYIITPLGEETIILLDRSLPFTIREKVAKRSLKVLSKIRYSSMIFTTRTPLHDGCSLVTLNVKEYNDTIMQLQVMVASDAQGDTIIRTFEKNPSLIYQRVVKALVLDDKELAELAAKEKEKEEKNKNGG